MVEAESLVTATMEASMNEDPVLFSGSVKKMKINDEAQERFFVLTVNHFYLFEEELVIRKQAIKKLHALIKQAPTVDFSRNEPEVVLVYPSGKDLRLRGLSLE